MKHEREEGGGGERGFKLISSLYITAWHFIQPEE